MLKRNTILWILWIVITLLIVVFFIMKLTSENSDKSIFLPGETSHGHHQIELACNACHSKAFSDKEIIQEACMNCHGEPLKMAKDKHPKSKFTDPRNADRVAILDARYCVTCHVEHRPEITLDMGVTMPIDYCHLCHNDIADERPSHAGMEFDTCASAGCHNYHDNQALYEDFLVKHINEPVNLKTQEELPELNFLEYLPLLSDYPLDHYPTKRLLLSDIDVPESKTDDYEMLDDWFTTSHAKAGVNCSACHQSTLNEQIKTTSNWIEKPDHKTCNKCHSEHVNQFVMGKHGMRLDKENLKTDLSPMIPSMARLPMKSKSHGIELSCNTCHSAHRFDTQQAKVEQCLGCHEDNHSKAFIESPHYKLWKKELAGNAPEGSGVSCATCHMPRIEKEYFDGEFYIGMVQHNQNDTLKPNEKMLRPVCMNCHGLEFSIDSLADQNLIQNNFSSSPSIHIKSIQMAETRMIEAEAKKKQIREQAQKNEMNTSNE